MNQTCHSFSFNWSATSNMFLTRSDSLHLVIWHPRPSPPPSFNHFFFVSLCIYWNPSIRDEQWTASSGNISSKTNTWPISNTERRRGFFFNFPVLHKVYFPLIAIKKLFWYLRGVRRACRPPRICICLGMFNKMFVINQLVIWIWAPQNPVSQFVLEMGQVLVLELMSPEVHLMWLSAIPINSLWTHTIYTVHCLIVQCAYTIRTLYKLYIYNALNYSHAVYIYYITSFAKK